MGKTHKHNKRRPSTCEDQDAIRTQKAGSNTSAIDIDGRKLEGGGQLLRVALCLSALSGKSIIINNIRGNRSGQRGLKNQHLACVQSLAAACNAYTVGAKVGSSDLLFAPGQGDHEDLHEETVQTTRDGKEVTARKLDIRPATPGAITLILQAVLPYLLFSPRTQPVLLTIRGATHTTLSPSSDYTNEVLLPNLVTFGLPHDCVQLLEHERARVSFGHVTYLVRPIVDAHLLRLHTPRPPVMTDHEATTTSLKIEAHILLDTCTDRAALTTTILQSLRTSLASTPLPLANEDNAITAHIAVADASSLSETHTVEAHKSSSTDDALTKAASGVTLKPGSHTIYMLLVATRPNGTRVGADHRRTFKCTPQANYVEPGPCAEAVSTAVESLRQQIISCAEWHTDLDEHMRDQIIIFLGLLGGRVSGVTKEEAPPADEQPKSSNDEKAATSGNDDVEDDDEKWSIGAGELHGLSLHAQTAIWVTRLMLGVEFDDDGAGVEEGWLGRPVGNIEDKDITVSGARDALDSLDLGRGK